MMRSNVLLWLALLVQTATSFSVNQNRVFVSTPVSQYPKRLVADCMTSPAHVLYPDNTVDEAIAALLSYGVSGAPVVQDGKIVGMVSSFDFLQKEAFEGALLPIEGSNEMVEIYVEAAKKICGQRVADIMSPNPVTVAPETSMRAAAELMTTEKLHRLPVVTKGGELVGILTSTNVMQDMFHVVRSLSAAKDEAQATP